VSEWQTVWMVLWDRVAGDPNPFEIAEIAPEVARRLNFKPEAAVHEVATLLEELARLPDGERFYRREGNAVVALPELIEARRRGKPPLDVYPFEL
jgi:hypothetical protein